MPEMLRLGMLVDAPGPCYHINVNPYIVEKVPATMQTSERLIVKCPVEGCGQTWYMLDPQGNAAYRD